MVVIRGPAAADEARVECGVGGVHANLVAGADVVIHLGHQPLELGEVLVAERRNGGATPTASRAIRIAYRPSISAIEKSAIRTRRFGCESTSPSRSSSRAPHAVVCGDPELLGERGLRRRLPGRDLAAQDRVSEAVVDERDVLPIITVRSFVMVVAR